MAGACGKDGDVAGRDFNFLAAVAAEANLGASARYAEHFVNRGVIVQIVVDAVAPHVAPAIGAEQVLDGLLGMIAVDLDARAYRPETASDCSAPSRRRRR